MTDTERLAEIGRIAQSICKKYDQTLQCEVFAAEGLEQYASLRETNAPSEGQVGIFVNADLERVSQINLRQLVAELEQLEAVWRVFLTFSPANSLS